MNNRAQVSLFFNDTELLENFIKPLKQERRLNEVVIKCLTSYYYDDTVRGLIDGFSPEEANNIGDTLSSLNEDIRNIQNNLSLMSYGYDEVLNTLDEGASNISDIMESDSVKQFYEESENESDNPIVNIEKINSSVVKETPVKEDTSSVQNDDFNQKIISAFNILFDKLNLDGNPFLDSENVSENNMENTSEISENVDISIENSYGTSENTESNNMSTANSRDIKADLLELYNSFKGE